MATETRQPTFEQLQQGIIKAHNAGDTAAAQRMAEILQELYPEGKIEVTPQNLVNEAQFASDCYSYR